MPDKDNNAKRHLIRGIFAAGLVLGASSCVHRAADLSSVKEAQGVSLDAKGPSLPDAVLTKPQKAPDPAVIFDKAVQERLKGSKTSSEGLLEDIRRDFEGTIWARRASFLLAVDAIEGMQGTEGSEAVESLLDDSSGIEHLGDYLLYFRARSFERAKRFAEAIEAYDLLLELYPASVLAVEVSYKKAEALFDSGSFERARAFYSELTERYPKSSHLPDALLGMAIASLELGDNASAARFAKSLLVKYPAHRASKKAGQVISRLKSAGEKIPGQTPDERFIRAERLFDATLYGDAVKELEAIEAEGISPELREKALIKKAVALVRLKEYSKVEGLLETYLVSRRVGARDAEALYWLSLSGLRHGDLVLLEKSLVELSMRFPSSPERAGALMFMGRYYEGAGEFDKAIGFFEMVSSQFPSLSLAEDALWSSGWITYRAGRFGEAVERFDEYLASYPSGKDTAKVLYWKARGLDKAGQRDAAIASYKKVCEDHATGYYCHMARTTGLSAEAQGALDVPVDDATGVSALAVDDPVYDAGHGGRELPGMGRSAEAQGHQVSEGFYSDAHYLAARELITLGLGRYASMEIDSLGKRYSRDRSAMTEVTRLFYSSGDYFRALRVYSAYLAGLPQEDPSHMYAYPLSFVEKIREKASAGVDEHLVAAVCREESSFNPRALSQTGAIGLMQIMPSTGRLIARGLGRETFDQKELFDPETNFVFGSWYLASLLKRFDNDMVLAIASYNAGPAVVERWAAVLPGASDEFIESIPYPETRNYAKKVLKSYLEFTSRGAVKGAGAFKMPLSVGKGGKPKIGEALPAQAKEDVPEAGS